MEAEVMKKCSWNGSGSDENNVAEVEAGLYEKNVAEMEAVLSIQLI